MWHMSDGWGWWMLFSLVWSGLFLAAVVWALLVPLFHDLDGRGGGRAPGDRGSSRARTRSS